MGSRRHGGGWLSANTRAQRELFGSRMPEGFVFEPSFVTESEEVALLDGIRALTFSAGSPRDLRRSARSRVLFAE